MKEGTKKGLKTLGVLAFLGGGSWALWKYVIKTDVIKLKDGKTIYKMGGEWFISNGSGKAVVVSELTKKYLVEKDAAEPGNCVTSEDPENPNGQRRNNSTAKESIETCLFSKAYEGYVDDCGVCVPVLPAKLACSDTGGEPDCFSQSDVNGNGYFNKSGGCSPCLKTFKQVKGEKSKILN